MYRRQPNTYAWNFRKLVIQNLSLYRPKYLYGSESTILGDSILSKKAARLSRRQQQQQQFSEEENTINFKSARHAQPRRIELIPKSRGQEHLIVNLTDCSNHICVAVGPAGTGKTYLAMLAAIQALRAGKVDRIVLSRPAVGVDDEKHGFLPGDLNQKMEPWTRPLLDVFREFYSPKDVARMIDDGTIEISPLAFMRGRTFKNAWIVADEMQNATPGQMKMLLTRIGQGSRIIVTGDVEQADRTANNNGLLDLCTRLQEQGVGGISVSQMTGQDVQRHPIIERVLSLYS